MTVVGMIFARAGSKGIPNKNLQLVAGKPLITRAVETARQVSGIDRLIVSTDSSELAGLALEAGAEVPFLRPSYLAGDASSEWLAWRHALEYLAESDGALPEAMVSIPTTSPLRLVSDVEDCLALYSEGVWDVVVTVTEAQRNPYFNMVRRAAEGDFRIAVPSQVGPVGRQDAPELYDMCTLAYVARSDFVLEKESLWEGRVGAVVIPQERALDIDTPFDLRLARLLLGEENPCPERSG